MVVMYRWLGGEVEYYVVFDGVCMYVCEYVVDVFQVVGVDCGCDFVFGGELQ